MKVDTPLSMQASDTPQSKLLLVNGNPPSKLHVPVSRERPETDEHELLMRKSRRVPGTLDQTQGLAISAKWGHSVGSTVQVYWHHSQETSVNVCVYHVQPVARSAPAVEWLVVATCPRRQPQ